MSQHTPGPWTWSETPEQQLILEGPTPHHDSILRETADFTVQAANARLIAAAPEMLDFISTDLMNFWPDKVQAHPDVKILLAKARALLARVEGRDA